MRSSFIFVNLMFNAKYFFQILFLKKEIDKHTNF